MSEHTHRSSESTEELEKIDITVLLEQLLHGLRRLWWLVILLTVVFALCSWLRVSRSYVASYTAEATLSISATKNSGGGSSSNYNDVATAEQMGTVFPYILTSGILSDRVAEDLGLSYVPGSISVSTVEGTNLITIRVTDSDGERAYQTLQVVIEDYPEVAQFVIGQTEATILYDSGVPEATGMETVTRGSLQRGALMGLVLGLAIVFLSTVLRRTIRSSSDFKRMLHVPCLGTIPVFQTKKRHKKKTDQEISLLAAHVPQDYLEAMRALRARVDRHLEQAGAKTMMVTSSIPGEGKSTIAANLAISFAQKGKRVILVDCDLRHPSVQTTMKLTGQFPGLAAVLEGKASLEEALCAAPGEAVPELRLLPGTPQGAKKVELLGSPEMKALIAELEQQADVVILDTPPSAMLADAQTLARNVPAALYVVRYDHTRVRHVLSGIEELSDTKIKVLGCVLNASGGGHSHSSYGYRYGYGYGYGRKYGYGYGYGRKSSRDHQAGERG